MRLKSILSILLLCAIGSSALSACSQPSTPSASNQTTESSPVAETPVSPSEPEQTGYPELLSVVSKTQAVVEANDFSKAQQEFDQFEEVWSQVEDGIKDKSAESYDLIEQDMDQVSTALRASQSNKAIAALQAMSGHIQNIPQN